MQYYYIDNIIKYTLRAEIFKPQDHKNYIMRLQL